MIKRSKGMTLIELMIAVAVVGILATIAYPSYQNQVRRSNRADAITALTAMANAQERFYLANNTYAATTPPLGFPATAGNSQLGFYSLAVPRRLSDRVHLDGGRRCRRTPGQRRRLYATDAHVNGNKNARDLLVAGSQPAVILRRQVGRRRLVRPRALFGDGSEEATD
jgi:prepilin-type N-terminal cleavage/methylation domain-containing protein